MSVMDGVIQCWPLAKTCEVWWEAYTAWAALTTTVVAFGALAVAWLSVGVTTISALAVWRLGREANRLALAPTAAAEEERRRERIVILSVLYGELMRMSSDAMTWYSLVEKFGIDHMLDTEGSRLVAAENLSTIDMPMTKSVIGRLHALPADESSRLARCLGIVSVLHASADALKDAGRDTEGANEMFLRLIEDAKALDRMGTQMVEICEAEIYALDS